MLKYLSGCIRETWALSMHGSAARGIAVPFAHTASSPTAYIAGTPSGFLSCPPPTLPDHLSARTHYPASVATTPTRTHLYPRIAYREPATKFSATSPPSMLPITRCSRYEIERPPRFSTPALLPTTLLRVPLWKTYVEHGDGTVRILRKSSRRKTTVLISDHNFLTYCDYRTLLVIFSARKGTWYRHQRYYRDCDTPRNARNARLPRNQVDTWIKKERRTETKR